MNTQRPFWDLSALSNAPESTDTSVVSEPGVRGVFFDSLPYKGKPTRSFAWIGLPDGEGPFPAMVLVHGGGGSAFADWVRLWNSRGYAAIAMDTCGGVPDRSGKNVEGEHFAPKGWPRHENSGPLGWGRVDMLDDPVEDQWMYHAVGNVILAHSLILSMDEVEDARVGLTGISWGGVIACIVAAVDRRFGVAAPVYGCGFLDCEDSALLRDGVDEEARLRWLDLWDPAHWLVGVRTPMLWINGTNDKTFPMPAWQRSYQVTRGEKRLSLRPGMEHGQAQGAQPEEIHAFAAHHLLDAPNLVGVKERSRNGREVTVLFGDERKVARAEICCTADDGAWKERTWQTVSAEVDAGKEMACGVLPDAAITWFMNLYDVDGLVSSSEHEEIVQ